ncbi:NAD(P)/FAD-dependent oxidoreductase [Ferroacidibacillus organovorans]
MIQTDIIVIGGGPAGLMAAIAAAQSGANVTMLEKGDRLGRKLLISGGGRCNVTNAKGTEHILHNIPGNGRFLHSVFSQWSSYEIIHFFESRGVKLKEEDRGRLFPVTDRAQTVLDAVLRELERQDVKIRYASHVSHILGEGGGVAGVLLQTGERVKARAIVLATGGCSAPLTGSTGDGYVMAEEHGHTIVAPYPTSVALVSHDVLIQEKRLQGLSLKSVKATLFDERGKRVIQEEGDLLFTHFGLSGPLALRLSHSVVTRQMKTGKQPLMVQLDLLPGFTKEAFMQMLDENRDAHSKKSVRSMLREIVPERLADVVFERCGFKASVTLRELLSKNGEEIVDQLKRFEVVVHDTLGLAKSTVTGGGIRLSEVDPRTLQSKQIRGLFFAGEILDVHAHTGGYNITVAFTTGHVAGTHAASFALQQDADRGVHS